MDKWTLELGDEHYQIVAPDGAESGAVEYGEPAVVEFDGDLYAAFVPSRDEEDEDFALQVFCLEAQPTAVEVVEFELEEAEEAEVGG